VPSASDPARVAGPGHAGSDARGRDRIDAPTVLAVIDDECFRTVGTGRDVQQATEGETRSDVVDRPVGRDPQDVAHLCYPDGAVGSDVQGLNCGGAQERRPGAVSGNLQDPGIGGHHHVEAPRSDVPYSAQCRRATGAADPCHHLNGVRTGPYPEHVGVLGDQDRPVGSGIDADAAGGREAGTACRPAPTVATTGNHAAGAKFGGGGDGGRERRERAKDPKCDGQSSTRSNETAHGSPYTMTGEGRNLTLHERVTDQSGWTMTNLTTT
jgi:hypothetical protein